MQKSMLLINGVLDDSTGKYNNTFRMIPTDSVCPYNEVVYDTEQDVLYVIGKEKINKPSKEKNKPVIEKCYEYYITTREEIISFIDMFCSNSGNFNYLQFMKK